MRRFAKDKTKHVLVFERTWAFVFPLRKQYMASKPTISLQKGTRADENYPS
jgi:hypothetical protein